MNNTVFFGVCKKKKVESKNSMYTSQENGEA